MGAQTKSMLCYVYTEQARSHSLHYMLKKVNALCIVCSLINCKQKEIPCDSGVCPCHQEYALWAVRDN